MKNNSELREQKLALVRKWEASGLNQKKFAEQENISYNNFNNWVARFKKQDQAAVGKQFIKLKAAKINEFCENLFSEIVFANGNSIRFFNAVEISELKKLVV